jgi:hypothetical protein
MRNNSVRPCPCGSGLPSLWQYDARGIELCRTCDKCHSKRMLGYRADVLYNPNYQVDEQIEADEAEDYRSQED